MCAREAEKASNVSGGVECQRCGEGYLAREVLARVTLGKYDWTTILMGLDALQTIARTYDDHNETFERARMMEAALYDILNNQGMTIILED